MKCFLKELSKCIFLGIYDIHKYGKYRKDIIEPKE